MSNKNKQNITTTREPLTEEQLEAMTDPNANVDFDNLPSFEETIELEAAEAAEDEAESQRMVKIKPRKTLMRTRICGDWYNFVKGQEQHVKKYVRDWLLEKNVL